MLNSPKARPGGSKTGLSLIEILVALALIGASSLLFTYFSGVFRAARSAQIDTQALNLARSYLDTYRASVAANAPRPTVPTFPNYTFSVDDTQWVANTDQKLQVVKVMVKGPGGLERSFVTNVVAPR
jgi:prepilin-type N-terminal cleavage/methylation domain-containing protein